MLRNAKKSKLQTTEVVIRQRKQVVPAAPQRSRGSRRQRRLRRNPSSTAQECLSCYINTLNDPFAEPPVRLGFNTMVPTGLGTAYFRSTQKMATDGSFAVTVFPFLNAANAGGPIPIILQTGGLAVAANAQANWANQLAYTGTVGELRPISLGVKIIPILAANDKGGIIYCGTVNSANWNDIINRTPAYAMSFPTMKAGYGRDGAMAVGRPQDFTSYDFAYGLANHASGSTLVDFAIPVVAGAGYPSQCDFLVEAVFNFEFMYASNASVSAEFDSPLESGKTGAGQETLSDVFPSVEQMWKAVRQGLSDTGITTSIEDLVRYSTRAAVRAASSYAWNRMRPARPMLEGALTSLGPSSSSAAPSKDVEPEDEVAAPVDHENDLPDPPRRDVEPPRTVPVPPTQSAAQQARRKA